MSQEGYVNVPDSILRVRSISLESKILYSYFKRLSGKHGCCWPKNEELAAFMGCCDRSIRRSILELAAGLFIQVETDGKNRKIHVNEVSIQGVLQMPEGGQPCPGKVDSPVRVRWTKSPGKVDSPVHLTPYIDILQVNTTTSNKLVVAHKASPDEKTEPTLFTTNQPAAAQVPPLPPSAAAPPSQPAISEKEWAWAQQDFLQSDDAAMSVVRLRGWERAKVDRLRQAFIEERILTEDWKTGRELKRHFSNYIRKGIEKGFILKDGTLKEDQTIKTQTDGAEQPRRKTIDEIRAEHQLGADPELYGYTGRSYKDSAGG